LLYSLNKGLISVPFPGGLEDDGKGGLLGHGASVPVAPPDSIIVLPRSGEAAALSAAGFIAKTRT
jgi:hypothetical protein